MTLYFNQTTYIIVSLSIKDVILRDNVGRSASNVQINAMSCCSAGAIQCTHLQFTPLITASHTMNL